MMIRINKFLAEQGICSRRKADELILDGRVRVDGEKAVTGMKIGGDELITIDDVPLKTKRLVYQYFAFHKPIGIMTSVDPNGRDTIATFLDLKDRLFPVGRLDVASSGLLILTNDGALSEAITHPRGNHEKEYLVTVDRFIYDEDLQEMEDGMEILGSMTKKARVKRMGQNKFSIVLTEGRNRQIRRMCEELGYEVTALKRVRVMNIRLGTQPVGTLRPLSKTELSQLKSLLKMRA